MSIDTYEIKFKGYTVLIDCDEDKDRIVLAVETVDGECIGGGVLSLNDTPESEIDYTQN